MPTLIVAASEDEAAAKAVQKAFTAPASASTPTPTAAAPSWAARSKTSIALAVGIALAGYGDNAKAALITRATPS